ncbi:MAG: hypothetical protein QME66_04310 [Candidatus Eisenbacteria bacterium]|nr:hypothetical protein [Candidatus Eisenbacteria bacterium]
MIETPKLDLATFLAMQGYEPVSVRVINDRFYHYTFSIQPTDFQRIRAEFDSSDIKEFIVKRHQLKAMGDDKRKEDHEAQS